MKKLYFKRHFRFLPLLNNFPFFTDIFSDYVFFVIKIKNHPTYQLEGLNLKRKLDIPFLDILLGTEKEFNTIDSKVKIKIPKLSEMNKTFRLKGKGLTDSQTSIVGDMYVTLNPILPKNLNSIEEDKLRQLKNLPNFK